MSEERLPFSRWWLVAVTALLMGAVGTYQFVWSSIRVSLGARIAAPEAALGAVFTTFVVFQTVSQFPAGWVRDRYGPRIPVLVAAPLVAGGYAGVAVASTPTEAYVAYAVGGVGAGFVYTVAVNTPVKWFDDRRGLATGIATFTYGGASFAVIPFLRRGMEADFRTTLFGLAGLVGVAVLLGVPILRDPPDPIEATPEAGDDEERGSTVDEDATGNEPVAYTWRDAVRTWQFWLVYAVFVVVNGVGLMLIGKVVSFAGEIGLSEGTATASASLVALGDAAGLIVVGGVSDRFDRVHTIAASLALAGLAMGGAIAAGVAGTGIAFVAVVMAAAFFRSPVFAILPGVVGDYYGTSYSSEIYAALYTAKLWGGVLGGVAASALIVRIDWVPAFTLGAVLLTLAGLALFFLRPVER